MSKPAPPLSSDDPESDTVPDLNHSYQAGSLRALGLWALAGAGAASLLSLIELADLSIQLSPIFQSLQERGIFFCYFSLNILGGLIIGLVIGICAAVAGLIKRAGQTLIAGRKPPRLGHRLIAGVAVSGVAAFLLHQQPQIRGYIIEIIREAEKFDFLTIPLLKHERSISYLMLMAIILGCSGLWAVTRWIRNSPVSRRVLWIANLLVLIGITYYVDSRFETQQYGTSVHRSAFMLDTALSMSLIATIFYRRRAGWNTGRLLKGAAMLTALALVVLVAFTFVHFGRNQNLKTQVFYRTTQTKQYFKLAQWALDFDRDGYSSLLDGGDCEDHRNDINPSRDEIAGDGVDHNCIGGPLSQQDIAEWSLEHNSLHKPPDAAARRLNVIYLFIDALRADHMSAYGYPRKTSPNLDKLAARSSLFENAYTPAPNTFEALPKFTQGTYWDAHLEGWPQIMVRSGYEALLFPRRITVLRRHVKGMRIVDSTRAGTFEESINSAISELGNIPPDRPFCAYLYSTDTHRPYKPHDEFNYGSSMTDLYDGELSYLDFHMGRLLDWLEQTGRMENTMIVIMADHGESLGERGVYKHSSLLYNEQTRVPMIIHLPGESPRRIRDYVSTIDLGPTILNAVGLDYPKECAGVSLVALMKGQAFAHPPVYGEQTTQEVSPFVRPDQAVEQEMKKYMIITQDGFKLIFNRDYYSFELFDLNNDPAERRNLYDRLPERSGDMKKKLGRFIDVVTVSRPWDADESQYFFGPTGEKREAK